MTYAHAIFHKIYSQDICYVSGISCNKFELNQNNSGMSYMKLPLRFVKQCESEFKVTVENRILDLILLIL